MKDNENIGLKSIFVGYLLHWKLFLAAFVFSLIIAVLYLVLYPRTYEMTASVLIQEERDSGSGGLGLGDASGIMKSFGLGGISAGGLNLEDELQIFRSNELFRKMILELGLNVEYVEPFTFGYKLYNTSNVTIKTDSLTEATLTEDVEFSIRNKSGRIEVKTNASSTGKKLFEFYELPAEIVLPQGTFILDYSADNVSKAITTINITYRSLTYVAEILIDEFLIDDYSKTANIIELTCTDYEIERGVDMLTSLIKHYNEQSYSYKKKEMDKSMAYYDGRIDSSVNQLLAIELLIEKYKFANRMTDIQIDVQFFGEQMKEIQVKLLEMEAQAHAVSLMTDFVMKEENKYNLIPMMLTIESGEKNPIVMYNEILLERSRVMQTTEQGHPLVDALTKKADEMKESVFLTIENARKAINLSIIDLKKREDLLYAQRGSFPLQEREFINLKRQQEVLQGIYLLLLQKREESALIADNEHDKGRVFETPYAKGKPVGPRKLYAAFFVFLFTLILPVGYLFCRDQLIDLKKEFVKTKNKL